MLNKLVLPIVFLSICLSGYSQNDKKSIEVMTVYEQMAKDKDFKNGDVLLKLANYNYFKAQYKDAEKYYGRLFALPNSSQDPQIYLRFARCLKVSNKNEEYAKVMDQFYSISAKKLEAENLEAKRNISREIKANSDRFEISSLTVNSKSADVKTYVFDEQNNLSSSSDAGENAKGKSDKIKEIDFSKINSKNNVSSPFLSKDRKTIYYTKESVVKSGKEGESRPILKLYKAAVVNGKCKNESLLTFCKEDFNYANAVLSPDEKTIYFVSDMPGGFGDTDLYSIAIDEKGEYSTPVNLGDKINTAGKETFPFIAGNGDLYFSSNEHQSIGGLDVFIAKKNEKNEYEKVYNVGTPVNSPDDDYSYKIEEQLGVGVFISNRNDKVEIYKLKEKSPLETATRRNCVFINSKTKKPIENVTVSIYNSKDSIVGKQVTNGQGICEIAFPFDESIYKIEAKVDGYNTLEKKTNILIEEIPKVILLVSNGKNSKNKIVTPVASSKNSIYKDGLKNKKAGIKPIASKKTSKYVVAKKKTGSYKSSLKKGTNLSMGLALKNTTFGFNKYKVTPKMATDLKKVSQILKINTAVKIQIRTRADARGKASYNKALTNKRATSIKNWLVNKGGVSGNRITAKGLGETELLNKKCKGNVKCLEKEHAINRKTDFIVVSN